MQKEVLGAPPQPMLPHGFAGSVFGMLMERVAAPNYRWVVEQLSRTKPRTYLEIGFGTGKLAELIARDLAPSCLCGVDPSELMYDKAARRLHRFEKKIEIDLRLGNADDLPWAQHSFDAIVASHSFQFWSDPLETLSSLRKLISPAGRLVFVVRDHARISRGTRKWIPNPITKSGKELDGLRRALHDAGFIVLNDEKLRTGSQGVVAACA